MNDLFQVRWPFLAHKAGDMIKYADVPESFRSFNFGVRIMVPLEEPPKPPKPRQVSKPAPSKEDENPLLPAMDEAVQQAISEDEL
jgi:hypothetical protein